MNAGNIGVAPASQGSASNSADRRDLGLRLNLVALALLAFFAATIFNGALPLRLLDPTWLEGIVQLLLSQAFLPLIALVLLHLAGVLNPESLRLRKRRDRYARFALAAALGFLLLIPHHLGATWGILNRHNASGQEQQRLQGLAVIGQLRQATTASTSHQALAQRLAALPILQSGNSSAAALGEAALRVILTAHALAGGCAALAISHGGRQVLEEDEAYFEALGRDGGSEAMPP